MRYEPSKNTSPSDPDWAKTLQIIVALLVVGLIVSNIPPGMLLWCLVAPVGIAIGLWLFIIFLKWVFPGDS